MESIEWVAGALLIATLVCFSGWVALDGRREQRRARLAAGIVASCRSTERTTATLDEEMWPTVAQQSQRDFPNSATIRIPRQVVDDATYRPSPHSRHAAWGQEGNPNIVTVPHLLAAAIAAGDPLRLAWPGEEPDGSGVEHWSTGDDMPTDVLPVVRDSGLCNFCFGTREGCP